ncbi:N-acetylmuramoyl-L-alanine amidase [Gillisia sp. M10.2A]|uniref:N-acetylmuramoyl-L-alanine amidase n=1 Tax=Gillisia lutea TaxID=2909668 RepID=A0ABS9EJ69_9FLAO|nr:N-acetylmuramoyl-L-alanine amidase [Gillisia lutea]MCF4101909.1 N-acetylmuramoyl-L-alanine amidase [Gillisia lutea]
MKNLLKIFGLVVITVAFAFTPVEKKTVVIDVSHGGHDSGVEQNGISEKEVVLSVAKYLKELNKDDNIEIVLTRDVDNFLSLTERVELINSVKPDLAISLHVNSSKNENANGVELFISDNSEKKEQSRKLAVKLQNIIQYNKSEIKKANFYLLKNVNYPIVVLELGFLTNQQDRVLLTSEEGQIEIAKAVYEAIR